MSFYALHSKQMVLPGGMRDATVIIKDGVIRGIEEGFVNEIAGGVVDRTGDGKGIAGRLVMGSGMELVDVGDWVVMPGVIDPHVHINEPGRTDWEGFDTATRSALAGGLTTLVDMPLNSSPVTTTVSAFDKKLAATAGQLHCNCGFWGGVVPGNAKEIEPLIKRGVLGFKAFLTHSGIDEFPNVTEADLRIVMPVIARYGLPLLVHCELESGIGTVGGGGDDAGGKISARETAARKTTGGEDAGFKNAAGEKFTGSDPRSYRNYLLSRPPGWEEEAIALMIRLCAEYRCRVHIVHLSSAGSLDLVRKAKDNGLPVTAETAPHYLYFDAANIKEGATAFKCAPPIRSRENNDRLWEGLREGVIDFVATDHSPAPPAIKELESGNFMKAWGGISSVQLAMSALWTFTREKGVAAEVLVKWLCEGPAALIGESGRRGQIVRGAIADLMVWDPDRSFLVTQGMLHHKHTITPYLGERLYGGVEQTWLGGEPVFGKGVLTRLNEGKIILNGLGR